MNRKVSRMEKSNQELSKITVVMAVYNAAKTLSQSIDSVLNQTYENWLMICVNDGSTDNSLDILYDYANKDSRITVLTKENGGPAAARAKAYEIVTTPYVTFLDADDLFSPDMLQYMIEKAIQTNADIVIPNVLCEQPDGSYMDWYASYGFSAGMELTGQECFSRTFINPSMHGILLWKTDMVRKFALGNNADYTGMNADEYIQRLLFLNSRNAVFSGGIYYYKCNQQSITKKFSIRQLGYLDTCRKFIRLIDEYQLKEPISSEIKEYYLRHIIHLQIRLFKDGDTITKDERRLMKGRIKEAYKDAIPYKNSFHFKEKRFSKIYRAFSVNGYWIFYMTCFLFAVYLRYKQKHNG